MKKSIFAVMAFVLVVLLAGCKKESKSELAVSVSEITDSTAVLKCEFAPLKSVRYKLIFGDQTLIFYRSMKATLRHLASGKRYNVVVIAQDADKNEVEQKVVEFMTTGEPDNYVQFAEIDDGNLIDISPDLPDIDVPTFSIVSVISVRDSESTTEVEIVTSTSDTDHDYSIDVIGTNYSQTKTAKPDKDGYSTTVFSGLVSGHEYNIYYGGTKLISFVKK
ncbi:MAG: hypothetical protein MJZ93_06650 [Paludibacteraceae bacterium]|nr:hypothetical protein [Paludibacteraceae bacterium]